jgi:hypothetical protein
VRIVLRRVIYLLPVALAAVLLMSSLFSQEWDWARIPVMDQTFGDLRQVTTTADCVRAGGWTMNSPPCDPWDRPYNYPPIWAQSFALFGVGASDTDEVGLVFGFALILVFVWLLILAVRKDCSMQSLFIAVATIASPPVALMLERGNTDGLIVMLVVFAAATFVRFPRLSVLSSSLAICLKVFPALIIWHYVRHQKNWRYSTVLIGVSLVLLIPTIPILSVIAERTLYERDNSFGASISLSVFFDNALEVRPITLLPINLLLTVGLAFVLLRFAATWMTGVARELRIGSLPHTVFHLCGLSFVGSYLTGSRYDYALTMLVPLTIAIAMTGSSNRSLMALQMMILVATWGASFVPGTASEVADVATTVLVVFILALVFAGGLQRKPSEVLIS